MPSRVPSAKLISSASRRRRKLSTTKSDKRTARNIESTVDTNEVKDNEIPITEILKKTHASSSTKYVEPVSLYESTTDTIYVQNRNGFNAIKINTNKYNKRNDQNEILNDFQTPTVPFIFSHIKIAIVVQSFWRNSSIIFHGLLGGTALLHLVMLKFEHFDYYFDTSISNKSMFPEVYANLFSFLIILCTVSTLDRFDVAHFNIQHVLEIFQTNGKSVILIPLYIAILCLHQYGAKTDDHIALMHYQSLNQTQWQYNTSRELAASELDTWTRITISKDSLSVIAWLFIPCGKHDMLLSHLNSMEKSSYR